MFQPCVLKEVVLSCTEDGTVQLSLAMNLHSFCVPHVPLTPADEPAQQPVPTQPLIWCELSAELTHLGSQEELGLMGRRKNEWHLGSATNPHPSIGPVRVTSLEDKQLS